MKDYEGRDIDYMRISITDRCNLRCRYCMPLGIEQVQCKDILSYEEIVMVCIQAVKLGIKKIKITGGEPLVRLGCCDLIGMIKKIPEIEQVTITTNGILLKGYISALMEAGIDGINISLDSLNPAVYQSITGFNELNRVLDGIDAAIDAGAKVKVNVLLQKGINEKELITLAELAKEKKLDVRFIEMMPIGYGQPENGISNHDVFSKLHAIYPEIQNDDKPHGNGPAVYYKIPEFQGSIGFISAMHGKFCDSCNRIRMTSQGYIKPCLCYGEGVDLLPVLRSREKQKEDQIRHLLMKAIERKPKSHAFEQTQFITENRKMIQIGG